MKRSHTAQQKKWMAILGVFFVLALFNITFDWNDQPDQLVVIEETRGERDSLKSAFSDWLELPSWRKNLRKIQEKPNGSDSILFWHIPKCGGTTAKKLYACMGKTITTRVGVLPQFGHQNSQKLVVFQPYPDEDWRTVNVDTTVLEGIIRAKGMGLVQSHVADVIVSMEMGAAVQHLFDNKKEGRNKGRVIALFRHPVERLVSKFYYLQVAYWEQSYHPEWQTMSILEWARTKHAGADSNIMVQKLTGKAWGDRVGERDLRVAKKILRDHVIVGLLSDIEESFRRFNIVLGVDETMDRNQNCMNDFFGSKVPGTVTNSNEHPKVVEGSTVWNILVRKNTLDVRLYRYVEALFEEQKSVIQSYTA
eukprot:CCRYP_008799-RA/>CCRYP_008799-RA protein AED:0.01 eAED:0.01 QI:0/-1/0/1/-1/1/1/0/363